MTSTRPMSDLRDELLEELTSGILPFWETRTLDTARGGFVGRIRQSGEVSPEAPKGVVLNSRILWSFSAAARVLARQDLQGLADRARQYILARFWDDEEGGVFWTVDHRGRPLDTTKKVYAQAFAVYGLTEYYRTFSDPMALEQAFNLFEIIEARAHDDSRGGYFEIFSREWRRLDNVGLGEGDDDAPKSMNTQLHVLEAYTNLLRCREQEAVRVRLEELVLLFVERIFEQATGQMHLFFEEDWRPRSNTFSYGHDIEAAWLLLDAVDLLDNADLRSRVVSISLQLAESVLSRGQDSDGGIYWSGDAKGPIDRDKHWWPQAEAIVGFTRAYDEGDDDRFLAAAWSVWHYAREHMRDPDQGEWFGRRTRDGLLYHAEDKVGIWKCPYHNTRACLELIEAKVSEVE